MKQDAAPRKNSISARLNLIEAQLNEHERLLSDRKAKGEAKDWKGLNDARHRSLELLRLLRELPKNDARGPAYELLVGTALCLWRAAFMRGVELSFPTADVAARKIVDRLLADNTIGYSQESAWADWFVGFLPEFRGGEDRHRRQAPEAGRQKRICAGESQRTHQALSASIGGR